MPSTMGFLDHAQRPARPGAEPLESRQDPWRWRVARRTSGSAEADDAFARTQPQWRSPSRRFADGFATWRKKPVLARHSSTRRRGDENGSIQGSCICGEVAFEVEAPFALFLNCHCSRCRKATGTAHSCEVIVKASALRWLRGAASVVRFDLPHARSFATAFCKTCGSPMPHLTRSGHEAIIPAGGFDEPLGAAPDRHVHWASRADWYVHGDGLLLQD